MSEIFDTTTIIIIVVAVVVLMQLRSILGKRTGHERPPFEPFEIDRKTQNAKPVNDHKKGDDSGTASDEKIVQMPGTKRKDSTNQDDGIKKINAYAKPNTKLNKGLRQVLSSDPSFVPDNFINGAKMAYEMIVTAFAQGDRKTLKGLLSREVFDGFAQAISDREANGEEIKSSFVGIKSAKITTAGVSNNDAQLTVEFISQIISATLDKDGNLIDGDLEQVSDVHDIWTFARDIRSRNPNWKLVATESDS